MNRLAQPTAWRLLWAIFALWAVNFMAGYAAVLIAPGALWSRLLLAVMAALSLAALLVLDRRSRDCPARGMVRAASLVAGLGILFNGVTALA